MDNKFPVRLRVKASLAFGRQLFASSCVSCYLCVTSSAQPIGRSRWSVTVTIRRYYKSGRLHDFSKDTERVGCGPRIQELALSDSRRCAFISMLRWIWALEGNTGPRNHSQSSFWLVESSIMFSSHPWRTQSGSRLLKGSSLCCVAVSCCLCVPEVFNDLLLCTYKMWRG